MSAIRSPHVCDKHNDLTASIALSKQIVDTVPTLIKRLDEHMLGEGHPLLAQRMAYQEEEHKSHTKVLEKLVESVTIACTNIKQLQDNQTALFTRQHEIEKTQGDMATKQASEAGFNQANWKTLAAVGLLVLGNIATLVIGIIKPALGQ